MSYQETLSFHLPRVSPQDSSFPFFLSLFLFQFVCIYFYRPYFKVSVQFVTICFCFMFWLFGHEACGILAPQPGLEPTPLALKGKVSTSGWPSKSQCVCILNHSQKYFPSIYVFHSYVYDLYFTSRIEIFILVYSKE